ncbi:MAG: xanthine dehydrogenase family protein [Candidatus Marinimicrobia bacterium]|nr:xanthine dehydrogenase family protein [Candidatus Neomarinimicrobiota bacterium]
MNRVDAPAKISGKAKYIGDIHFENQLFAKTVRSARAKAKIVSIKTPTLPDDYYIIDKNDIPGINRMRTVVSDHPIFAEDEVNYIGQPIVLVVGPEREKIYEIVSQIKIKYKDEAAIYNLEEAEVKKAVFTEYSYSKGEPKATFQHAERIIEDEYRTGRQEHIYLEPQGITGDYKDGCMYIYGSLQCPFYIEGAIQDVLGWDSDRIRIIQSTTGGAFGGKEEFPSLMACQVAVASIKTKRPVKMIYDRDEDIICSTKRHPSIVRYKAGLNKNNEVVALDIDIKFDAGAYSELSPVVLQRGMFSATGVYNFPNLKVRGRNFMTNNVPSGAFRGFGAPQTIFSTEMLMHNIAVKLGTNPLDYKIRHLLKRGYPTCTSGKIRDEVKLPEIIEKVEKMSWYRRKIGKHKKFKGVGLSLFLHGCGFTGKGEATIKGKIILKKNGDTVTLKVSSVEMGQGAETCLRKIVAHTLSLPMKKVICETIDTGLIPNSGPTVASRTIMIVGGLLRQASLELKDRWNDANEIEISKTYKHPDFLSWDDDKFEGDAYPTYSWGTNVAEIEIDPVTYEIDVKKITAVYDVGVPIDEKTLEGQIQGGIVQGIGWATIEVMNSPKGKLTQHNLTDYKIPTSMDVPEIECEFIENPYEFGPFGAKCAGELPFVGAPPAVAAAVSNAMSVPIRNIPITPEYLMELDKHED